jgi:hypothetical protein
MDGEFNDYPVTVTREIARQAIDGLTLADDATDGVSQFLDDLITALDEAQGDQSGERTTVTINVTR